jgi:hypothetical protein
MIETLQISRRREKVLLLASKKCILEKTVIG